MIVAILSRWADASLQRQVTKLEAELEAGRRAIQVLTAERDNLAAVIARDRERIRAEGACFIRQRVEAEGRPNDGRID